MNFLDARLPQRFWDKVQPCPMSGCWLWTGGISKDGYGGLRIDSGPMRPAHLIAFHANLHAPKNRKFQISQLCRVRRCVNPLHLGPRTILTDYARAAAKAKRVALAKSKPHANRTHGHGGYPKRGIRPTPEYQAWINMRVRCTNPNSSAFPRYGGRGIKVCDEWTISFESFLAHVGPRPSARHSIDRIDVNGDYEPGNVQWTTADHQARNQSTTVCCELSAVLIRHMRRRGSRQCDLVHAFGFAVAKLIYRKTWTNALEVLAQPESIRRGGGTVDAPAHEPAPNNGHEPAGALRPHASVGLAGSNPALDTTH